MKNYVKNAVLRGTVILTFAGILSRVMGFFYRIFLKNYIGADGMGMLQLIIPIMGTAFAVCTSGINTAISKFTATKEQSTHYLWVGCMISMPLSLIFAGLAYLYADTIAIKIMLNPSCAPFIRIMCLSMPFMSFHSCISGYYYGCKTAGIPAASQLIEQFVRIISVFIFCQYIYASGREVTVAVALYGNLLGELASSSFCFGALILKKRHLPHIALWPSLKQYSQDIRKMIAYALPINLNQILLHLFESGEAILVPAQLVVYGLSSKEALSIYGILTGMAIPLLLFPSAITNSLSVMLLPKVSGDSNKHHDMRISQTIEKSVSVCLHLGIMCSLLFICYGGKLGAIVFNEPKVNNFVMTLAWLCPFLYLKVTLGSILNGLSLTMSTCVTNIAGLAIRIGFLIFAVPKMGIQGYLYSLLISNVIVCLTHYIRLNMKFKLHINPAEKIITPASLSVISVTLSKIIIRIAGVCLQAVRVTNISIFIELFAGAVIACIIYMIFIKKAFNKYIR